MAPLPPTSPPTIPADNASPQLPPVSRAFVQRHRLPAQALRADGRVVLTIDQRWRVQLIPAPHHRVAIQSELLALPEQPEPGLDDLLLRLARAAAGLAQQHPATLAIDRQRQALVLQQTLPAGAPVGALEEALTGFTNTLPFWAHLCQAEPVSPPGGLT